MTSATHIITTETSVGFVVRGYSSFAEAEGAAQALSLETRKSVGYDEHGTFKTIGGFSAQGHSLLTIAELGAEALALIGEITPGETKTITA